MPVELVAHRGASRERTENTLEAFALALERQADAIELDVHLTADGAVIVHHDFDVAGRQVSGMTLAEVRSLELRGGGRIPLLAEVLDLVAGRAMVYVELKGRGIEREVWTTAQRGEHRCAFHSFDHDTIERLAALAPGSRRGLLLDRGLANAPDIMRSAVRRTGARDVWPHWSLVDAQLVEAAHALGTRVIPWTVNDAALARALVEAGVDALCTDDVRLVAGQ